MYVRTRVREAGVLKEWINERWCKRGELGSVRKRQVSREEEASEKEKEFFSVAIHVTSSGITGCVFSNASPAY